MPVKPQQHRMLFDTIAQACCQLLLVQVQVIASFSLLH